MRQAGRYLPEYRELRARVKNFLTLCYTPDMAAEVTLQPIRRFGMDAAIVFSDILVIPHAMGCDVTFQEGEGPRMTPVTDEKTIKDLRSDVLGHLAPVADTLMLVRRELPSGTSLIGFCGAPWTVACYMVEGKGSRDFEKVRRFARTSPELFSQIIEKIVRTSIAYLAMQVKAGADAVQIFDSWAGVLSPDEYARWVIAPTKAIVEGLKALHPEVPIIGFAKGSGVLNLQYAKHSGVDAIGIDVQTPMGWAKEHIALAVQGNLDPIVFATDKAQAVKQTKEILKTMQGKPFIFNLGHGVIPSTPVDNVQAVCDAIREGSA